MFDGLMTWVQHKPEERLEYLPNMLQLIRIEQFSLNKLFTSLDLESTLEPIGNCQDFLKKVQSFQLKFDNFVTDAMEIILKWKLSCLDRSSNQQRGNK